MGSEVTVVEVMDRVLPVEDEEISAFARKAFEKQGMKIITGAEVKAVTQEGARTTSPSPSRPAARARRSRSTG